MFGRKLGQVKIIVIVTSSFTRATSFLVSFAAVVEVVTQSLELCIPFLKLTNKEQASIFWKPDLCRQI